MTTFYPLARRTAFYCVEGVTDHTGTVMVAAIRPADIMFASRRFDPRTPRLDWLAIAWSALQAVKGQLRI